MMSQLFLSRLVHFFLWPEPDREMCFSFALWLYTMSQMDIISRNKPFIFTMPIS